MPAAGSKGAAKNPGELKDDTSSSRDEKQVTIFLLLPSATNICFYRNLHFLKSWALLLFDVVCIRIHFGHCSENELTIFFLFLSISLLLYVCYLSVFYLLHDNLMQRI